MRTSPVNKNKVLQTSATAPVWAVGGSSFGSTWGGSFPPPSLCTPAVCLGKCPPLSEPCLAHLRSGAVLAASEGGGRCEREVRV